jgi:Peptidase family M28
MPMVLGRLPGAGSEEILLQAHLCHRGPGANDNASGAALLLGIAAALRALGRQGIGGERLRSVRFLWGPEFLATAAYLHDMVGTGTLPAPVGVMNFDMVGESQTSGAALIVEDSRVPSVLEPLVDYCLSLVPDHHRSYGGVMHIPGWRWRSVPFAGGSDHALFADRSIGIPAIQFGHWPDPFNHTSADGLDKVDWREMRRVGSAATAAVLALCTDVFPSGLTEPLLSSWAAQRLANVLARGQMSWQHLAHPPVAALEHERLRIVETAESANRMLVASADADVEPLLQALPQLWTKTAAIDGRSRRPDTREHQHLLRAWDGPFNLLALLEDVSAIDRQWLLTCLDEDAAAMIKMTALAMAVDDQRGRAEAIAEAELTSALSIESKFGDRFISILERAGWVVTRASESERD